jgi:hypothetical protein
VAAADTWTDPAGRLTFEKPSGWQVEAQGSAGTQTTILAFNASNDCYLFGLVNPQSASRTANDARNATAEMTAEAWTAAASVAQMRRDFFPNGAGAPVSQSVDTSGYWPVQRAQFQGARTVFGAIETRPGFELRAFCSPTSGNSSAAFESILRSLGHPNDATWQAQAAQQSAERQAAASAAAQAQQQPQQQEDAPDESRRNGRDTREGPTLSRPH